MNMAVETYTDWRTLTQHIFQWTGYRVYDKLGNGYEVEFPVRMCSRLKWSSMVYAQSITNLPTPKCKHYEETCAVWLVKRRC